MHISFFAEKKTLCFSLNQSDLKINKNKFKKSNKNLQC